jgi:mono/diheme cytochrome c family protein
VTAKRLGIPGIAAAAAVVALSTLSVTASAQGGPSDAQLLAALTEEGDDVFHRVGCSGCHGDNGQGGNGPMLAGNDYLAVRSAVVAQIMNPDTEHGGMPAFAHLSDREIAAVATYVRNSWGNEYGIVPEEIIALFRGGMGDD